MPGDHGLAGRPMVQQQPQQVALRPAGQSGVLAGLSRGDRRPVPGQRGPGDLGAAVPQPRPLAVGVGLVRLLLVPACPLQCLPGQVVPDLGLQCARLRVQGAQQRPAQAFPRRPGSQPELDQPCARQPGRAPAEAGAVQEARQLAEGSTVMPRGRRGIDPAVRVRQRGQGSSQLSDQLRAGQVAQRQGEAAGVAERELDGQRILDHAGGHQAPASGPREIVVEFRLDLVQDRFGKIDCGALRSRTLPGTPGWYPTWTNRSP